MIFLDIFLGIVIGFVLGLIPCFHINVLAYLLVIIGAFLLFPDKFYFFFSLAITMTIISLVPLLLFNISTPDNFTLNLGRDKTHTITTYIYGTFFGSLFSILLLPIFYMLFVLFSDFYLLIFAILFLVLIYLVFLERRVLLSLTIISFAGALGLITLKYNFVFFEPLLPCIFGLFALPTLLVSLWDNKKIGYVSPVQEIVCFKSISVFSFLGALFSSVIAIIPSLSPGIATIIPSVFSKDYSLEKRKILLSSTLISVILVYFFMAAIFRKSRIGYVSILLSSNQIPRLLLPDIFLFCFVFLFVVSVVCFLLLHFYPHFFSIMQKLPKKKTTIVVIVFSIILILLITNIYSIFLIILSCAIGFLPIVYNKNKLLLMSYLILPTILFFI